MFNIPGDLLPSVAAFARVAQCASFTQAAAQLGISPSALSQTVRSLEKRLNVRLLNRTTRHVGVTELGRQFLEQVQPALEQLGSAINGLDERKDLPAGLLRINLSHVACDLLLKRHKAGFFDTYPEIRLELIFDNRLVDVVSAECDAGIRLGESLEKDMIAVPLGGRQRTAIFASPAYLERRGIPQQPEDLINHQCMNIRRTSGDIFHWELQNDGRDFEIKVSGNLTGNDNTSLTDMVREGMGIGYAFEHEVSEDFARGTLTPLLEEYWPSFPGFYLYYPSRQHMPRKLRVFIDYMQEKNRVSPLKKPKRGPQTMPTK